MQNRKKDFRIGNAGDSRREMENGNTREKEAKERDGKEEVEKKIVKIVLSIVISKHMERQKEN